MKNLRYVLLKNPEHLSENQRAQLQFLTEANPRLYRVYLIKEGLRLALKAGPEEIADAFEDINDHPFDGMPGVFYEV